MELRSYFDFAEDDYRFFEEAYKNGTRANSLGATAQLICERYLKHVINEYFSPQNDYMEYRKENILHTHALDKLLDFIDENMNVQYSDESKDLMRQINGYYFSTRYPGEDSVTLTESAIERCKKAIEMCREGTVHICEELDKSMEINDEFEI